MLSLTYRACPLPSPVLADGYQRSPEGLIYKDFVEGNGECPVDGQVGGLRALRAAMAGARAPLLAAWHAVILPTGQAAATCSYSGIVNPQPAVVVHAAKCPLQQAALWPRAAQGRPTPAPLAPMPACCIMSH